MNDYKLGFLFLGAGSSSRMLGDDKLLKKVNLEILILLLGVLEELEEGVMNTVILLKHNVMVLIC